MLENKFNHPHSPQLSLIVESVSTISPHTTKKNRERVTRH